MWIIDGFPPISAPDWRLDCYNPYVYDKQKRITSLSFALFSQNPRGLFEYNTPLNPALMKLFNLAKP